MRPLRVLSGYIAFVFLGGAPLAPWLHWLAQATAEMFPHLAAAPFYRSVNRSLFLERADYSDAVTWHSGLELLPRMMRGFTNWQQLVPGFFNLTLAGALLALAYQRSGNLNFSVGPHAGWIFWIKSYGALTTGVPGRDAWLLGTGKMIDGWLALAVLALAAFTRPPPVWKTDAAT